MLIAAAGGAVGSGSAGLCVWFKVSAAPSPSSSRLCACSGPPCSPQCPTGLGRAGWGSATLPASDARPCHSLHRDPVPCRYTGSLHAHGASVRRCGLHHRPPVRGWATCLCHQQVQTGPLLYPLVPTPASPNGHWRGPTETALPRAPATSHTCLLRWNELVLQGN